MMEFIEYSNTILSIVCLISIYICYTLSSWSSSLPTNWPLLGMMPSLLWNIGHINDYITSILKENGGTFMYKGPWFSNTDILVTSDPANYRHISTTKFHNYVKGPKSRGIFEILGDGIFNCDSDLWELHRKTTMSLFKQAEFLKLLETTIWNKVEKKLMPIIDSKSKQGCTFDLQEIFQRLTFDSILILLIDYDPETLSMDLPYNKFERAFTKAEQALFNRHFMPKWLWKLLNRLQISSEKYLADAKRLSDELLYKAIKENQKKNTKTFDATKEHEDSCLLTGFMREYKDQTGIFDNFERFIRDTLFNLMVAGRDTTSSALTWFFYLLAQHPAAEAKIHEEIHAQLGMKEGQSWKSFSAKDLEKLVYLHGALCEALRLFPPLPANQKLSLQADTLPSGHQVHKNTDIILHSYSMGRMETIWGQDSLEFKPERWILKNEEIKYVPSYNFTTFHAGQRTCIGKQISFIEMKIVAATVIYNYHVKVMEGHPSVQNASVFIQHKHGLMVKLTRRNEVEPY